MTEFRFAAENGFIIQFTLQYNPHAYFLGRIITTPSWWLGDSYTLRDEARYAYTTTIWQQFLAHFQDLRLNVLFLQNQPYQW